MNKQYDLYEVPKIQDIKDMMCQKKDKMPEKTAFAYTKGKNQIITKSYKEFYEDVTAVGTWLYKQNLGEKHIAVIGENSYEWLVCFFAIVCGGGVAVPMDKELPAEEMARLLYKADVCAVIYSKSYREAAQASAALLAQKEGCKEKEQFFPAYSMADMEQFVSEGKSLIASGDHRFAEYKADPKKMCCIMFTSGTTGNSKGVMLSHENIAEDINGSCKLFVLEGNSIAVLPFHHAFGLVVSVFMVFHYGYTIYINRSLKRLQKDLELARPQTMFLVPLFVETFHKQIWAEARKTGKDHLLKRMMKISDRMLALGIDVRKKMFSSVRRVFGAEIEYIICGGALLGRQYIQEFRSWGIEILNGYGTTECAPCAAVNRNYFHKDGTVGLGVPGIDIAIGEDGEVYIKGPIVMLGYYKEDAATDEVLKDGWYATGDLGYLDEEGFLTLTGRKKNLIILSNGENISSEELETDFLKYEAVKEVLVFEQEGRIVAEIYPDMEYLKEYVEEDPIQDYFEVVRRKINSGRPMYKQVSGVRLRTSEFPKNTSRKILRF